MFDDIIGTSKKPTPLPYVTYTRGEVVETNKSGHIIVMYVDPADGEMYYFKYITKKKFKSGDEVEIFFENADSGKLYQICERWTIGKKQDDVCVEEVRKVKK